MFMPYWWIIIPGLILGIYAQMKVSSTYRRYSQVPVGSGMSGAQAARAILDHSGLRQMEIHETRGHLTDHYDPTKKALFLSSDNYHGRTLAAVGVAAHEAGHALQHQASYAALKLRMLLVPATSFASGAYLPILLVGVFFNLIKVAIPVIIGIFAIISLFQLITLPVEFDASRRAKQMLGKLGIVQGQEALGVSRVLSAAAMTYVAAMITSVLNLAQWVLIAQNRD